MNQNLKTYKLYKVKNFIKNPPLILIFHTLNLKTTDWLKIEQNLINSDLKYYKIRNTLAKHVLKNSVFLNFSTVLNGSLCFIYPKNNKNFNNNFQKLSKISKTMPILTLKLNKKMYSSPQLSNISTLNYKKNISILNKTLKTFIKTPYYKFKG